MWTTGPFLNDFLELPSGLEKWVQKWEIFGKIDFFQKFSGSASGVLGGIQIGLFALLSSQMGVWNVSVCPTDQIHFRKFICQRPKILPWTVREWVQNYKMAVSGVKITKLLNKLVGAPR